MVTDMEMQLIHFHVVPQFKKTTKKCFVFVLFKAIFIYIFFIYGTTVDNV